jgi:hypothetical protein
MNEENFKIVLSVDVKVVDSNNNEIPNISVAIESVKIKSLVIEEVVVNQDKVE